MRIWTVGEAGTRQLSVLDAGILEFRISGGGGTQESLRPWGDPEVGSKNRQIAKWGNYEKSGGWGIGKMKVGIGNMKFGDLKHYLWGWESGNFEGGQSGTGKCRLCSPVGFLALPMC